MSLRKQSKNKETSKKPTTMADLLAGAKNPVHGFSVGQKVTGRVLEKTPKSLIIDIGGKGEGIVTGKAFIEARDFIKSLEIGKEVIVTVLVPENREGYALLSLRHSAANASWEKLEKAKEANEAVAVVCRVANSSGLTVEVEGITGFIPGSQLGQEANKNPQALVGKYFKAIPLIVAREGNKLILSEKEVSKAKDLKEAKKAILKIKEGMIYEGQVTTVASFGVFVKIEIEKGVFVEGLVHISQLSWSKVGMPSDVVGKGDIVRVKVIGVKEGKLALSIKGGLKDPWEAIDKKYEKETKVKGKVTKVSDFGVFVEVEPGVEGLIHLTKIPPATKLTIGQEVDCYVEEIDTKSKKLALGLVLTSKPIGYK